MKIWLVGFPTYKYNEDVKALAIKSDLKIIDARFKDGFDPETVEKKPPTLTIKEKYKKSKVG